MILDLNTDIKAQKYLKDILYYDTVPVPVVGRYAGLVRGRVSGQR